MHVISKHLAGAAASAQINEWQVITHLARLITAVVKIAIARLAAVIFPQHLIWSLLRMAQVRS